MGIKYIMREPFYKQDQISGWAASSLSPAFSLLEDLRGELTEEKLVLNEYYQHENKVTT